MMDSSKIGMMGLIVAMCGMTTNLTQACDGDLTSPAEAAMADGIVGSDDLLAFVDAWGSFDASRDFNADESVDVMDLLEMLHNWGDCPPEMSYGQVRVSDVIFQDDVQVMGEDGSFGIAGEIGPYVLEGTGTPTGGQCAIYYGTAEPTWPAIKVIFEVLPGGGRLELDAWVTVPADNLRLTLAEVVGEESNTVDIWVVGEGPPDGVQSISVTSDELEAGTYSLKLRGMVLRHALIGNGIGMEWSIVD